MPDRQDHVCRLRPASSTTVSSAARHSVFVRIIALRASSRPHLPSTAALLETAQRRTAVGWVGRRRDVVEVDQRVNDRLPATSRRMSEIMQLRPHPMRSLPKPAIVSLRARRWLVERAVWVDSRLPIRFELEAPLAGAVELFRRLAAD
jgi:hypothetical protein